MNDLRQCTDKMINDLGRSLDDGKFKSIYADLSETKQPALPLNVRVAKALGPDWLELPHDKYPNYDSDLTLAMGALEEYCEKEHIYTEISVFDKKDKYKYFCGLYEYGNVEGLEMTTADHLPTAICEAIVKHKEGK